MRITDAAIKYRTSILVLVAVLVVGGLISYVTLPKESQPSIEIPMIVVTTIYPGASPDDVESLITQPIEREVQSVNDIKEIRSTSTEGVSTVIVEFNPSVPMDDAYQKVRDKVSTAKAELPTDVEEPIVSEIDIDDMPIVTVNLAAPYSLARLKEVGENVQDELETIGDVLEVDLIGGLQREVQVNVDLNRLQGYNLTFNDLVTTIRQENTTIPGGSVDVDNLNYFIRVSGEFDDPQQILGLVVKAPNGRPIYVRDVADVVFGFKDRSSYARLQQLQYENADDELITFADTDQQMLQVVSLNVKKRPGANIIETVAEVERVLEATVLPTGTEVLITGDQSVFVEDLVKDLENNIIAGIIFVVAVLLFFLGVRNAMLVGIAIPLSMLLSFILFSVLGYTLNMIILFSLIIALGMLVDNAVVIVENIYRYREEGHTRWESARKGTGEVGIAVVASTATTVAAFAPMLGWPGMIGKFMSYMPLTLIITLTSSLIVALLINPVITGYLIRLDTEPKPKRSKAARRAGAVLIVVVALVLLLANPITLGVLVGLGVIVYFLHKYALKPVGDRFVETGLPRIIAGYREFLHWMLERDYTPKRAFLRNMGALGLFTGGFVLLILGGLVGRIGFVPEGSPVSVAGLLFLVPGAAALLLGVVGIMLHTVENIFLGKWTSVKTGGWFGALIAVLLGLIALSPRALEFNVFVTLIMLPVIIIAVGLLGAFLAPHRDRLVLTDNRARLMTSVLGTLVVIVGLFGAANPGTEFFPTTDPQQIWVNVEGPLGTNIEASNRLAEQAQTRIKNLLEANPASEGNIKNVQVNVGVGGDVMFGGGAAAAENSRITLNVVDYADRPESSSETMRRLREELQGIPGATIEIEQMQMGPPTGSPVNIEISGETFDEIVTISRDVKRILQQGAESGAIPGLVDVRDNLNSGRPELKVDIDRERAARFGLNTQQIAMTVRSAIQGTEASKFRDGEDEYDVTVRLAEADRASLESLRNLTILNEGQQVPLVSVADFSMQTGLGSVTRLDLERVVTVQGGAAPGFAGPAVLQNVLAYQPLVDYQQSIPSGYTLAFTGESEDQQESFGFLFTALLIGVALIFMIMVAQFNSVSTPFIIMIAVGLSLIGVLLGLILTRTPFGLMTFIGVISLAGIVVNNNIVLIDYMMQLRERGLKKQEAIIEAGATRLRPVLLTALTTVIGLVPLTFGINVDFVGLLTNLEPNFQFGSENTQFWGPMGTAIISGLTFATFLTLVIVPVMYSIFDSLGMHAGALFRPTSERPVPAEAVLAFAGNGHGDGAGEAVQPEVTG